MSPLEKVGGPNRHYESCEVWIVDGVSNSAEIAVPDRLRAEAAGSPDLGKTNLLFVVEDLGDSSAGEPVQPQSLWS